MPGIASMGKKIIVFRTVFLHKALVIRQDFAVTAVLIQPTEILVHMTNRYLALTVTDYE